LQDRIDDIAPWEETAVSAAKDIEKWDSGMRTSGYHPSVGEWTHYVEKAILSVADTACRQLREKCERLEQENEQLRNPEYTPVPQPHGMGNPRLPRRGRGRRHEKHYLA
jgi:hypothetical protein